MIQGGRMAKGITIEAIEEAERGLVESYQTLLDWIQLCREDDWTNEKIEHQLQQYRGLSQEAIDTLMNGNMPGVDVVERLEAAVSRSD